GDPAWDAAAPADDPRTARLVNEIYRKPLTLGDVTYHAQTHTLDIRVSFAASEAAGLLREFGIFGGDATATRDSGYLVSYRTHPPIDRTTPQSFDRAIELTLGES